MKAWPSPGRQSLLPSPGRAGVCLAWDLQCHQDCRLLCPFFQKPSYMTFLLQNNFMAQHGSQSHSYSTDLPVLGRKGEQHVSRLFPLTKSFQKIPSKISASHLTDLVPQATGVAANAFKWAHHHIQIQSCQGKRRERILVSSQQVLPHPAEQVWLLHSDLTLYLLQRDPTLAAIALTISSYLQKLSSLQQGSLDSIFSFCLWPLTESSLTRHL